MKCFKRQLIAIYGATLAMCKCKPCTNAKVFQCAHVSHAQDRPGCIYCQLFQLLPEESPQPEGYTFSDDLSHNQINVLSMVWVMDV